jgi:phosphoribosylaminoimidazole-succinocarboxamide synthase
MSSCSTQPALFESELPHLKLLHRGKVRDVYEADADHLLIVTTDRLSAFDVILPNPIPGKGQVLTEVANFWFARTTHIIGNHLAPELPLETVVPDEGQRAVLAGRAIVVRKLRALPIEAVVRGYLIGSGWKDYQATGEVCGVPLPAGLRLADRLPEPIFTPATKAAVGDHDENIAYGRVVELLGQDLAEKVRSTALKLYEYAAAYALERGIIIADTKFEFGLDQAGRLVLIDEALTPDSSRFWPVASYAPGTSPPSFDKQFVRDYLETLDWNKRAPGPQLPPEVITRTADKYAEALRLLTT